MNGEAEGASVSYRLLEREFRAMVDDGSLTDLPGVTTAALTAIRDREADAVGPSEQT